MKRFVIANEKLCMGCSTCMAACIEAHRSQGLSPEPRLSIKHSRNVTTAVTCRQCENAPCAAVCPTGAITVTSKGVAIAPASCNGCQLCVAACPFGVMKLSVDAPADPKIPDDVDGKVVQAAPLGAPASTAVKCDLCDFVEGGPECVRVCPTKALAVIDAKAIKRMGNARRKSAAQNMRSFARKADSSKS